MMLSPREREYLKNIPAFEDEHGRAYAKVVRSRIRKKALIGLRDLWLILYNGSAHRRPLQELQRRKGVEIINEVKSGELSDELREQAALGQVLGLLTNNPNKGRREDSILGRGPTHNVLIMLVHMLSKREREFFLELLKDDGIKDEFESVT
jgi:hypothetical protein